MAGMEETIRRIVSERDSSMTGFEPDVHGLLDRVPRAEGLALISYSAEEGPGREQSLLELVIREDGGLRLICGRGPDTSPRGGFPPPDPPPLVAIALPVLALSPSVAGLT